MSDGPSTMKFVLNSLTLTFRRSEEIVPFYPVSYFWGQMGAGKTSIARLIDYCLGGEIQLSPAMQSEFVGVTLSLSLPRGDLTLERPRDAARVVARWGSDSDAIQVSIPTRDAAGEVVRGTGVETLSDLLFWMSNIAPPRVRRSKLREDSATARLSIRDLLWYCYLDQDEIDSSFFHLDSGGDTFKRLKSRDVLRFIIGFHSERIAEIETALDELRGERQALISTIAGLSRALSEAGVESEDQILGRVREIRERAEAIAAEVDAARQRSVSGQTSHAADELRVAAWRLGEELASLDAAITDLRQVQDRDHRHLNEIETLTLKFRRSTSARAVLSGVAFEACPRCAQALPPRGAECCHVCGQPDRIEMTDPSDAALIERDARSRVAELRDILERHEASLIRLSREREALLSRKGMKNISERENRRQFEGFYGMLYELAAGELAGTQMILIDKEYSPPPPELGLAVAARHMTPDDPATPPLIPYYRGK